MAAEAVALLNNSTDKMEVEMLTQKQMAKKYRQNVEARNKRAQEQFPGHDPWCAIDMFTYGEKCICDKGKAQP